MNAAHALLMQVKAAGGMAQAHGDRLYLSAPHPLPDSLIEALRAHKNETLAFLANARNGKTPEYEPANFDGVPTKWIDGVIRLVAMPRPRGVMSARWRRLQMDAAEFTERWAAQAAKLGWGVDDLYGVNKTKPFVRLDAAGLVRLLDGRPAIALTADEAVIECRTGSRQAYRRKPANAVQEGEQAMLWEIDDV